MHLLCGLLFVSCEYTLPSDVTTTLKSYHLTTLVSDSCRCTCVSILAPSTLYPSLVLRASYSTAFMSYIMHEKAWFMLLCERRLCLFWWTDRSSNKPEAFSHSVCPQVLGVLIICKVESLRLVVEDEIHLFLAGSVYIFC